MRKILKNKYTSILIVWLGILIISLLTMPSISKVVREKGQIKLPENLQSQVANKLSIEYNNNQNTSQVIAVFNRDGGLTDDNRKNIVEILNRLKDKKDDYSIKGITSAADSKEAEKQLLSEDKTTELALISVDKDKVREMSENINTELKTEGLNTYVTGSDVLTHEFANETQKGIKKTEIISIVFILAVLIIVFRSWVAPLLSLITVGISLIVSLNITMNLAWHYELPLSNFTQVFLAVVLLGIGTDYNILLYTKFKEELTSGIGKIQAAKIALRTAGKTIIYSGSSVFIGFAVLGLADFIIYQSAVSVAIGIAVLLLNLLTLNMFFMTVLGEKMFLPNRKAAGHKESKLWSLLSGITLKKPVVMLGVMLVLIIPFLMQLSSRTLNYNDADELPETNFAKQGYTVVEKHFSKGMIAPVSIYIGTDRELTNKEDLSEINKITTYLKNKNEVDKVLSVTEPTGEKIDALYLKDQFNTLLQRVGEAQDGIKKINSGLSTAKTKIEDQDVTGKLGQVNKLADGANKLADGTVKFNSGLGTYVNGVDTFNNNIESIITSPKIAMLGEQMQHLSDLSKKIDSLGIKGEVISNKLAKLSLLIDKINANINDPRLTKLEEKVTTLSQITEQLTTLKAQSKELTGEVTALVQQTKTLNEPITKIRAGGDTLLSEMNKIQTGSKQISDGTNQLNNALQQMGGSVNQLTNGLSKANTGLSTIDTGITDANSYLKELGESFVGNTFYVPNSVLNSGQLNRSFDQYLSKDKKVTKLTVVLKDKPSTLDSAKVINSLDGELKTITAGTSLKDAKIAIGGQTSQINDLENLTNKDFTRSATIMLIGIAVMLIAITRSIVQPIAIVGTLIGTYFASLSIAELLSKLILGKEHLAWNAPFFIFIMLIALGVDYSIFLAMRYKENINLAHLTPKEAIYHASGTIGGVVISAAIILGGTFAALYPSGITTLIHVALGVIVGLAILAVVLPIIMSAVVKLSYGKNIVTKK
ncbi:MULTISPECIES: MMPL family transporter [Gemella]|uniref:MMPL family transporter n=1 Tax=Gemella TaxID=1378 RepID=UPI000767FECF|nr:MULTISPECIES: MMPL family transporter [Gemella]AME09185.1 hypothetical protein AXE85_02925 [Gemella sp. oral taxon 928]AXI26818.1 MMPL family transporter [Gemella sp. ND 6198]